MLAWRLVPSSPLLQGTAMRHSLILLAIALSACTSPTDPASLSSGALEPNNMTSVPAVLNDMTLAADKESDYNDFRVCIPPALDDGPGFGVRSHNTDVLLPDDTIDKEVVSGNANHKA